MSGNQPARQPKKNPSGAAKNKPGGRGGQKRSKKQGKKKRGNKKSNKSAIDPNRPVWENHAGEAELHAIVGSVRPAHNPTAIVRSLGEPPLGKYASNAHHYYEAVYEKAQHFAVAIATANGLLVVDGAGDDDTGETAGDSGGVTSDEPPTAEESRASV